jgi:hypothetical protein
VVPVVPDVVLVSVLVPVVAPAVAPVVPDTAPVAVSDRFPVSFRAHAAKTSAAATIATCLMYPPSSAADEIDGSGPIHLDRATVDGPG